MFTRVLLVAVASVVAAGVAWGQTAPASPQNGASPDWAPATADDDRGTAPTSARAAGAGSSDSPSGREASRGQAIGDRQHATTSRGAGFRRPTAKVSTGTGQLPNEHGQLWREYDISPYTLRVASTTHPEQAIRDWILRETGYEAWTSEPLAILSVNPRTLIVYHTPEMHEIVADICDRFVSSEAQAHSFGLRVVSLSHPNWRARAQGLLHPVQVQTPGVEAWLLQKEDAAVLLAELGRRSDYREHSSPHLLVSNGQSSVVSATRGRSYVRNVALRTDGWPGVEPETAIVDEGFSLEFSPLLSVDGEMIDATIKCEIDQVEKMISVPLEVSAAVAPRQRTKIEVPQMSHFHFHERFRWPVDQVLLVGFGMVPLPVPTEGQPLVAGLPLPLPSSPPRADVLVFVQSNGKTSPTNVATQPGRPEAATYRGRY
jgi:hypothetical protein